MQDSIEGSIVSQKAELMFFWELEELVVTYFQDKLQEVVCLVVT